MNTTNHHIDLLLEQCKNGNQHAQLTVYKRYYKAMYNTSLRIVKDSAEAEDVMQESFLSAFTKLDSYSGETTFGSWLKRIVVNNSISSYNKRNRLKEDDLDDTLYKLEEDQGITECDTNHLEVQRVLQTMNHLKENYRMALTLNLIEGYDYEEMSDILGISYANCRTTVSRAKESLRKKLSELITE
ncbi:MAG TPA: RNA polymerase subunit sigma [Leeuwenhoekiella sp.]|uniref:RNA polymerase sigma factor n=1 Tax=Leeuwenhoekiella palythoae TaxID=573501 RepID=UPI000E93D0AD|nr:RNA polymerase sigma factor [Leeuwenhoekiella palythoae]UBZ10664.1 RNA polymerase sigma factor [Leeuwenhoekiella palythoae]HAX16210.1 RNA polymerase subunit sigma [Leeuwenhoekiella sp.]HBO30399.1 RNA polymerase subunit sigma [Leeuwenhoekiella sp.]HCQ78132.1 RNA polymerase subunit sigma [Leeuwenhoekiella sp.]